MRAFFEVGGTTAKYAKYAKRGGAENNDLRFAWFVVAWGAGGGGRAAIATTVQTVNGKNLSSVWLMARRRSIETMPRRSLNLVLGT